METSSPEPVAAQPSAIYLRSTTVRLAFAAVSLFLFLAPAQLARSPGGVPSGTGGAAQQQEPIWAAVPVRSGHAFYFTRGVYTDFRHRNPGAWSTDYPKADEQFLVVLKRLTRVDAFEHHNPVRFDDPRLRHFPIVYAVEVGQMQMTDAEVAGLRSYLLAGGLLIADDFWGPRQFAVFEEEIRRVLPEYRIEELPEDHPIRRNVYHIEHVLSVPNVYRARMGLDPAECDDCRPGRLMGISDETGRLLVLISFNSDLGDAWEWAEQPYYPLPYSNYAFRLGVNWVVFGMTN